MPTLEIVKLQSLDENKCLFCGQSPEGEMSLSALKATINDTEYEFGQCYNARSVPGRKCGPGLDGPKWLLYTAYRDILTAFILREIGKPLTRPQSNIINAYEVKEGS